MSRERLEQLRKKKRLAELRSKQAPQPSADQSDLFAKPEISPGQAAALGAAQGLTMGFSDEILAATETGKEVISDAFNSFLTNQMKNEDNPSSSIAEKYAKNKKNIDAMFNQARLDNPGAYLTSDIAGSLASTLLTLGGGAAIKAGSITKSAMALSKHAGVGFAQGVGRAEDDTIEGVMKEGAIGAGLGVAGEIAGPLAGKGYGAIKGQLSATRAGAVIKFLGDKYSTVEQNLSRVGKPVVEWAERLIGYTDEAGKPLMKTNVKRVDLLEDVQRAQQVAGSDMGKILKEVDADLKLQVNTGLLKQSLKDEFVTPLKASAVPEDKAVAASLEGYLDSVFETVSKRTEKIDPKTAVALPGMESTPNQMNLSDLHAVRSSIYKYTKNVFRIEDSVTKEIAVNKRNIAKRLGESIDDLMETASPESYSNYVSARTKYGDLSETISALENGIKDEGQGFIKKLFDDRVFAFTSVAGVLGSSMGLPHSEVALAIAGLKGIAGSKAVNGAIAKSADVMLKSMEADPQRFASVASKLISSSALAGTDFMDKFNVLSAETSFIREPLARDPQEVIRRSDSILTVLDSVDKGAANHLRSAIEKRDFETIGSIMSQVANEVPSGYVQQGIGWGGKAYTQQDKAAVESYLRGIKNSRKRMLLTTEFSKTNMIPQEMGQPVSEPSNIFIYNKAREKVRNPEY